MSTIPENLMIRRAREYDLGEMARIHSSAYPGNQMTLEERLHSFRNNPRASLENYWVCERSNQIVGMFVLYDFMMNRMGQVIPVGGIGSVAVSPEARRDRIAYYMMQRSVEIMEQNGTPLSILYPFKHQFYHKLGWGLVVRLNLYHLAPEHLPKFKERTNVEVITTNEQREEVMLTYNKFAKRSNGLLQRTDMFWNEFIYKNAHCYAYRDTDSGLIEGYLTYRYRPHPADISFTMTDLEVWDFVYNSTRAFRGLISFLSAQRDQVKTIFLPEQSGLSLEHILSEPISPTGRRNWLLGAETALLGSSLMGRVISIRRTLKSINNWGNANGLLNINVTDDLYPQNSELITISFEKGKADFVKGKTAKVQMNCSIATLSSLIWGGLNLSEGLLFGLIELEGKGDASFLKDVFTIQRPVCMDYF